MRSKRRLYEAGLDPPEHAAIIAATAMRLPMPMTPHEDWPERSRDLAQALARAGTGDRAAFAALYQRTCAHLFAVVLRICKDRALAEDVLQDVYVRIWQSAGSFDAAQSQPLTWMTSIARHRAIDSLRRAQTQPRLDSATIDDDEDRDMLERTPDDGPGPLDLLSRAADARALAHCMQALSAAQRHSVALAFYDGLSHAEVARNLGQPIGTVKSWVRRGLLALKSCLDRAVERDASS